MQSWECHKCHAVNAPHVNQCPCSAAQQAAVPNQIPFINIPTVWTVPQKCLFEGLPPGAYGLHCPCPRCTPQCAVVTSSNTFDNIAWYVGGVLQSFGPIQ